MSIPRPLDLIPQGWPTWVAFPALFALLVRAVRLSKR